MPRNNKEQEATSNFGKLFAELRKTNNLSTTDVASHLGVDFSTVAKIETGTRPPFQDPDVLERLGTLPGFTEPQVNLLLESRVEGLKGLTAQEKDQLKKYYSSINPRAQIEDTVLVSDLPAVNLRLEILKGDVTYPEALDDLKMMVHAAVVSTLHRFRAMRPKAT